MTGARPFTILGLTGSMAMGKSTTAKLFAEMGLRVIDSDAIVHQLYDGPAVAPLAAAIGPHIVRDGSVNRAALARHIAAHPESMKQVEAIVHPLVRKMQEQGIEQARAANEKGVLLDIPLLFETGADARVDHVVVVTTTPEIQRQRAMARPGMTPEKFEGLLARQMPDAEKRRRANFIIDTSISVEDARRQVEDLMDRLQLRPEQT